MLNVSLGWLNVSLGFGGLMLRLGFRVEVEEKVRKSVNGRTKGVLQWLGSGWSRILKQFSSEKYF